MRTSTSLLTLSILLVGILLTSCGTFTEEVWINADGSGRYSMDYDASESLAMLEMLGEMGGDDDEKTGENEEEIVEEELQPDPEDVMKEAFTREKFDTTFNLMSVMPDSVKQIISSKKELRKTFTDRGQSISDQGLDSLQNAFDLLGNLDFAMRMDKAEKILGFGMTINFDEVATIANTFESMSTLKSLEGGEGGAQAQAGGMADKMGNRSTFEMVGKNKLIVRQAPAAKMDELLGAAGDSADGMETEQMEGMLEMMGLGSYEVKVHVPGIIKSVEGASYVKENDNTVIFTVDYLSAMRGGDLMEAEITFKPKKKMKITVPK